MALQPTETEIERSASLQCGICLEPIVAAKLRFGLLEGCDHAFCVECIRGWRATHETRPDVTRSCPECRAPSHFIVPSAVHHAGERKAQLINHYKRSLHSIPCRHFDFGRGKCPFGSSCFYAHTDQAGRAAPVVPRKAYGEQGSTVLASYNLSDYLFPEANEAEATRALLDAIPLASPTAASNDESH